MDCNYQHIAFFMPSFDVGGVEKVLITYANALAEEGYQVDFIVCQNKGNLFSLLDMKVNTFYLNRRVRSSLLALLQLLKLNRPNLLITGPDFPNIIALIAVKLAFLKIRLLITQHNYFNIESKSLGIHGRLLPVLIKILYPFGDKVIAVSDGIAQFLLKLKLSPEKVVRIYNPINIDDIRKKASVSVNAYNNLKYIVFVGRLCYVKNLPLLFNSFNIVSHEDPNIHLVVVGDGELLQQYIQTFSNDKIHFVGSLSNPYRLLKEARLVVLPSFSEGFPVVLEEALALGVNVVTTPTPGAVEILEQGKYGFISDSYDDSKGFSQLIKYALNNPYSPELLKARASIFDIHYAVKQLKDTF